MTILYTALRSNTVDTYRDQPALPTYLQRPRRRTFPKLTPALALVMHKHIRTPTLRLLPAVPASAMPTTLREPCLQQPYLQHFESLAGNSRAFNTPLIHVFDV